MAEVAGRKKQAVRGRKKQRVLNRDGDDGRRGWSELPTDIVELFMRRLPYINQINLRATCKSWHSVGRVPTLSGSHNKHMPWLLGINMCDDSSWSSSKLSDPTYKKVYTIDMSPLKNKIGDSHNCFQVHESKSGWLLISWRPPSQLHHLIVYSPFLTSNNIYELPVLTHKQIILATFSFSNSDSSSYDGWSFLALSHVSGTSGLGISTCTLGDNTWITRHIINSHFSHYAVRDWIYSQGLFYYATKFGEVGTLNVDGEWSTLPGLDSLRSFKHDTKYFHMIRADEGVLYALFIYGDQENNWQPTYFSSHRLDLSQPQATTTWELKFNSLGQGQAFFLENECKSSSRLISNTPKDVANRIFQCSGRAVLKYSNFYDQNNIDTLPRRSYPCCKRYGSFSKQLTYRKFWVEPPTGW